MPKICETEHAEDMGDWTCRRYGRLNMQKIRETEHAEDMGD
jgi:hypothetical protein